MKEWQPDLARAKRATVGIILPFSSSFFSRADTTRRSRLHQVASERAGILQARPALLAYMLRSEMKRTTVIVPWKEGIHLRRAGSLARLATRFRSSILCRLGEKVADGRSVISILILCASLGATLEIEASGPDEREAIQALDAFFASSDDRRH